MGMLRRRSAALAVGATLFTAGAAETAPTSSRHRKHTGEKAAIKTSFRGEERALGAAEAVSAAASTVDYDDWESRDWTSVTSAAAFGDVAGDGEELIPDISEEEDVANPDLAKIFLQMIGARLDLLLGPGTAVLEPTAADEADDGLEDADPELVIKAGHETLREVGVGSGQGLAEKLIAGLDGSEGQDVASKIVAGAGLGRPEEENLADMLFVGVEEAKHREEFATTLSEAFDTARRGRAGGELAEKLLTGLKRDGGGQKLAATLLVELDASHKIELAAALLSGLRDAGQHNHAHELSFGMESARDDEELTVAVATAFGNVRKQVEGSGGGGGEGGGEGGAEELLESLLAGLIRLMNFKGIPPSRLFEQHSEREGEQGLQADGYHQDFEDYPRERQTTKRRWPQASVGGGGGGGGAAPSAQGGGSWTEAFDVSDLNGAAINQRYGEGYGSSHGASSTMMSQNSRFGSSSSSSGVAHTADGLYRSSSGGIDRGSEDSGSFFRAEPSQKEGGESAENRAQGVPPPPPTVSEKWSAHNHDAVYSLLSRSFDGLFGELFHRTFAGLMRSPEGNSGEHSASPGWAEVSSEGEEDGHELLVGEAFGRSAKERRLQTSTDNGGNYQLEIVASTGATSTDWNDALYKLEVGMVVPGQTGVPQTLITDGTIDEGDPSPYVSTVNLARGCYVLFTTGGTRPYDVLWEVQSNGELYQDVEGGGMDYHTFGVGGALCGMSECYRLCYEEHDDRDTDECASLGDLLAPSDEPAGANCNCTQEEEIDLRITCLEKGGCDPRSQCYMLDEAGDEITEAPTLTLVTYVTVVTSSVDTVGMETAVGQWLDFDPAYVELIRVNGEATGSSSLASRRTLLGDEEDEGEEQEEGVWLDWRDEELEEGRRQSQGRGLQTATFKRLEFRIIGQSTTDFAGATETIVEGVRGLNSVLAALDEDFGVNEVQAYTAEYFIDTEYVPTADAPEVSIADTGVGAGVDEDGEEIDVATEAPVEGWGDFTRQTQFLIGAGLVVVTSIFLGIVACMVCRMKRKERREFKRKNATVDGQPKAVAYVDPWGSVARTFQKDSSHGQITGSSRASSVKGGGGRSVVVNGTANSSASA